MEKQIRNFPILSGRVTPPGDKSISHRGLILNGIAQGTARLSNLSPGADCLSTLRCLQALGVRIEAVPGNNDQKGGAQITGEDILCPEEVIVYGVEKNGLQEPQDILDAGNSGTTIRLLTGLLAGQPFFSVITGDGSLRARPMGRLIKPLRMMGAEIWGRNGDSVAPLAIKGKRLCGTRYMLPVASAQLKSALLIAGLYASGTTEIEEPAASRDHTERLLRAMDAHITVLDNRISVQYDSTLKALDLCVPGDISAAAFWLVAGAIHSEAQVTINNVGINPTRTGIIDVLQNMGANLKIQNERTEGGEPVADLVIKSSRLTGTVIEGELIPRLIDEIPIIAVAATMAEGTTTIRNAEELRVKESDRIMATVKELSRLGAKIEELPDGMVIHGGHALKGATCDSYDDHRLAMSLAIAGLVAEGETVIKRADAVTISYPSFWRDLESLTGSHAH